MSDPGPTLPPSPTSHGYAAFIEAAAKSPTFPALARLAILVFSIFGPTIGGYLFYKYASTQDEHSKLLATAATALATVNQKVDDLIKYDIGNIKQTSADHESRLRTLERAPHLGPN